MQEVFVCCAASDRHHAEPIVAALRDLDALSVTVEECEPGELPDACAAAADADGVVLLLSAVAVPRNTSRAAWAPVLDRLERAPASIASVQLASCAFPASLHTRGLHLPESGEAPRMLRRWAITLADGYDRFEVPGYEEQYDYRDVVWIPCAGRSRVSIEEALAAAVDGRRVLIVLDGCPEDLAIQQTTREHVVRAAPVLPGPESSAHPVPAVVATCYPDFLHRDFCARRGGVDPSQIACCLQPVTSDRSVLRVPAEARRRLDVSATPRRRHAELLNEVLAANEAAGQLRLITLELPAALDFAFATDWNFAAGLAWRAYQLFKDVRRREAAELMMRLRQSAVENEVRSWVGLADRELGWLGVPIPAAEPRGKKKASSRQLTLEW